MLSFLEDIKEYDALFFMPNEVCDLHIQSNIYKEPGTPVGGGSVGPEWHIVLFQHDEEEDKVINLDHFDAILSDPREYISSLIPEGWFGVVARKTTTSETFLKDALDMFKDMC